MKSALPVGFAVLGALWPVFTWLVNLNGRISVNTDAQAAQEKRIERVEHLSGENFKEMRDFLEKVDRRLSRIEGRLEGREWRHK